MDEQQLQQQIVQLVQAAMQGDQQAAQQIQQIMQAAQQGDPQATQIAQMIQAVAQQMQQSQVRAAKFGAKLNYIRQLRGECPEGYEMKYYKSGGKMCKKCIKKAQPGAELAMEKRNYGPFPRKDVNNPYKRFQESENINNDNFQQAPEQALPRQLRPAGPPTLNLPATKTELPEGVSPIQNLPYRPKPKQMFEKPYEVLFSAKCGGKLKKKACGGRVEQDKCGSKLKKKACGGIKLRK